MGCNCGKNKASNTNTVTTKSVPQPPRPRPPRPTIGPARGQTQSFTLTLDNGRTARFGSSLEARAALARAGGRGTIA